MFNLKKHAMIHDGFEEQQVDSIIARLTPEQKSQLVGKKPDRAANEIAKTLGLPGGLEGGGPFSNSRRGIDLLLSWKLTDDPGIAERVVEELATQQAMSGTVTAQSKTQLSYPKQLEKDNKEYKREVPTEGATERQLDQKKKDNTIPFEKQLSAARTGSPNRVAEGELNEAPKLFNDKRDDRTHHQPAKSQDLVAEAYHQKKLKAFRKARKGEDRDTSFWDKYVNSQMINEPTKIVKNEIKTQLQNTEDRFADLKPELKEKIDGMVVEAMQSADKLLFHIYATAASEKRDLTKQEKQQIVDITSGKARILVAAQEALKTGQFGGIGQPLPPGQEDTNMGPVGGVDQPASPQPNLPEEVYDPDAMAHDNVLPSVPVIRFENNQAVVYDGDQAIDFFPTAEEAKQNYPEASLEGETDQADPGDMDGDLQSGLASAGLGTDEDYNPGMDIDTPLGEQYGGE